MKKRLLYAYQQSPWRTQIQWVGLFLLAFVLITAVLSVYLNISAKAAIAGRNIQYLENDIDDVNNEISDLRTELALAKSLEERMAKLEDVHFKTLDPLQAIYLEVPGYQPDDNIVLASPSVNTIKETPIVKSTYKISLWEWFRDNIWNSPNLQNEVEGTP